MPDDLASLKSKISSVLQDVVPFLSTATSGDVEKAIREALEVYDDDAPREVVVDTNGDGTSYDFDLPSGFVVGFSRIISIEYPVGNRPATLVAPADWGIYHTPSEAQLRFNDLVPANAAPFRMTYTARHTVDDLDSATATTVWAHHAEAFVNLCAARCLLRLANRFIHEQESTLNLDAVDRNSKTDVARRMSDKLMAAYREVVGVARGEAPASASLNWSPTLAGSGIGLLTHRSR